MVNGGHKMRGLREKLGLTMREVQAESRKLAKRFRNSRLIIVPARLSVLESKNVAPNLYRLYVLARIYRRDVRELMTFYGLPRFKAAS